jgi:hypothetical protein
MKKAVSGQHLVTLISSVFLEHLCISCGYRMKYARTNDSTTNKCYNEQFLSIKSGCYNKHRRYNVRFFLFLLWKFQLYFSLGKYCLCFSCTLDCLCFYYGKFVHSFH